MAPSTALTTTTDLLPPTLPLLASGKVRDLYALDAETLLFVATDRISAYDVVLSNGVPGKGRLLTLLTAHWIALLAERLPNVPTHFISLDLPSSLGSSSTPATARSALHQRSCVVRKLKVLPLEAIVRGYLTGSAWAEYQRSGTVHDIPLPAGLRESEELPGGALYTPSTKAPPGEKDENISPARAVEIVGPAYAKRVEELSLAIYAMARDYAAERDIIIADTKFEFGVNDAGEVVLADELLTPDSSRFWPKDQYEVGRGQKSFDKQGLRDWLTSNGLKGKEGISMPEEVVNETAERYREAYQKLVGKKFDD